MKAKLSILAIILLSVISGFSQFNGYNVDNLTAKTARYDSTRTITNPLDFTPQWYVDQAVVGYVAKPVAEAATTTNITLSGNQTIDGFSATTDDTILVKDQTNPAENGIYFVGTPWVRADYADSWAEIYKSSVFVTGGTLNSNSTYASYMDATGTLESDSIYWNLLNKTIIPTLDGYVLDSLRFKNGRVYAYFAVKSDSTVVLFTEGDLTESISGMAITGTGKVINGDLNLELQSGYQIPSVSQLNDAQTAYQDKINSIVVTGAGTKTITLTQQDATTLSDSFSDLDSQNVSYNQNTRDVSITKGTGFNLPLATNSIPGLLSSAKSNKLDSLPYNGGNWTGTFDGQEGTYYRDYTNLTNKPTIPVISNAAYGVSWNGNLDGASKDAIYDKIETLGAGAHAFSTGHTDVLMSSLLNNNIPQWNGSKWVNRTLSQAGIQSAGSYVTDVRLSIYQGSIAFDIYKNNVFTNRVLGYQVNATNDGYATSEMYLKLDSIQPKAEVNARIDWDTTNVNSDSYIHNKPDVLTREDTLRNAAEPIPTRYVVDSLIAANGGGDSFWSENVDTISPVKKYVRLDSVLMGTANAYLAVNASHSQTTKLLENGVNNTIYQTKRYVFNETGLIRYKIATSDNVTYYLQRQINGGGWVTLKTIACPEAYIATVVGLKCSNFGDVVAYTDFISPNYKLLVSRDYGNTWTESVTGNVSTVIESAALDISDDGSLVACAVYKDAVSSAPIYLYKDALNQIVLAQETRRVEDIKVLSDSTIYYTVIKTGSSQDRCLYKIEPEGTQASKHTSLYGSYQFDVENNNIYVCDSAKILKSTNGGTSFSTLYDFGTSKRVYQVNVSDDETYIYATTNDGRLYESTNSGGAFTTYYTGGTPARYANIEISEGIYSDFVKYYFENGRQRYVNGWITMPPSTPSNRSSRDVATIGDIEARMGTTGAGDITAVNTAVNSGLKGGTILGDANLSISIPNIVDYKTSANLLNGDRMIIGDGNTGYGLKFVQLGDLKTFIGASGSSGVTSLSATNGLTVNANTGAVTVGMGTPSTLSKTSTNIASGTTHTHSVNLETFTIGDLSLISNPTVANTILKWNGSTYDWVAQTSAGVSSLSVINGIENTGTSTDPILGLNFNGLTTTSSPLLTWNIPVTDGSIEYKMTLQSLKTTLSSGVTVQELDGTPIVADVTNIKLGTGLTLTDNGAGSVTINAIGGGGSAVSPFHALSGASPSWDASTYRNARLTMPAANCNLAIAVAPVNGDIPACLVVIPDAANRTLNFPAGYYFTNGHSKAFNIEAGVKYCFTFRNTGDEILIDYSSHLIAN